MNSVPITVLLVEDDAADAELIQRALAKTQSSRMDATTFRVEWLPLLSDALVRLKKGDVEVVLLDLSLQDAKGIEAFDQVLAAAPDALILVMSATLDEVLEEQLLGLGAHDYLEKNHVDARWIARALRYIAERKTSRRALANSEGRFRAMSDACPLGIFVSDIEGRCIYTNLAYQKIAGLSFEQTLGTNWITAIHPEDRQNVFTRWCGAVRTLAPFQCEMRFLRDDDTVVWTRLNGAAMLAGDTSLGYVQTIEDVTARVESERGLRAAEEALYDEKERAQVTLNSIGDAVLSTDLDGNVIYLNPAAERMTGWKWSEALGQPLLTVFNIIDGGTRLQAASPAQHAIDEGKPVGLVADCVLIRRDGVECPIEDSTAPIHNRAGRVTGAVIAFHDVSASRSMTLKMSHQARHDPLTGLANRLLLADRLSQAIALAQRHCQQVAVLFLDLDDFKHINDSLGHAIGDQLLKSVAKRLIASVRASDAVFRLGGDEFVILLSEIEHQRDAAHIAEKLLAAFALPHTISGFQIHVTLSIGISIYPDDDINMESVIQDADTAMYHSKASGRNNYQFFKADMNTRALRRRGCESGLRRALEHEEFLLYYQPKLDLASGAICGVEALIRWQDPELGLIAPDEFVPIAEACGLIVPIGRWVLREACSQMRAWQDAGLPVVPVAVNVSAVEFRHRSFLEGVAMVLRETRLDPKYLELELTESILMHEAESSALLLEELKAMGVRLAIDDFGTGYSSLNYLKRFPIDTLKIDKSFVRDIAVNADDAIIVSAVIGMGKNLKQRVIAEGVETAEQLAFLKLQQCDEGQGFLFSHPLAARDFGDLLSHHDQPLPA